VAQMIGDGPNRGTSAPPPRKLPKGKAAERLSREHVAATNKRNVDQVLRKANPNKPMSVAEAIALAGSGRGVSIGTEERPMSVDVVTPDEVRKDKADKLYFQALDNRMKVQERGGVSADGQPASVFRGLPQDVQGERDRNGIVQGVADSYTRMAQRQQKDERRLKREKADRKEIDKVLTPKEWAKLTPLQQAAVQANYDLANAVARDFKLQSHQHSNGTGELNEKTRRENAGKLDDYQERFTALFGDEGTGFKGLEFAPNTVAMLDKLGIEKNELAGRTLDDFASGDALIDMEGMKSLGKPLPATEDPRSRNLVFAKTLATGQLAYQEQLAAQLKRGDQLLGDVASRSTNARAATAYGAVPMDTSMKLTKVRPETLAQLGKYLEILARPNIDLAEGLDTIALDLKQIGADDEEQEQVWANLLERTRQATTGEAGWFDEIDYEMRSPLAVAQALGAPTLKRATQGKG